MSASKIWDPLRRGEEDGDLVNLEAPLYWRKPRRITLQGDLFDLTLSHEEVAGVFGIMAACPRITFEVSTAVPERADRFFRWLAAHSAGCSTSQNSAILHYAQQRSASDRLRDTAPILRVGWPLPNVRLGAIVHDREEADARIPALLHCPAALRFVDYVPSGPVDFGTSVLPPGPARARYGGIDWLRISGEVGPEARPHDLEWTRQAIRQCRDAGVPVYVERLGRWIGVGAYDNREPGTLCAQQWLFADGSRWAPPVIGADAFERPGFAVAFTLASRTGSDMREWPADLRVREMSGKKESAE